MMWDFHLENDSAISVLSAGHRNILLMLFEKYDGGSKDRNGHESVVMAE